MIKVRIRKNEFGEYEVRTVRNLKVREEETYYTDDLDDAKETKKAIERTIAAQAKMEKVTA